MKSSINPEAPADPSHSTLGGARMHSWPRIAIGVIAAFSLFLGLFRLNRLGYANQYYAAAVRSMTESWHAFIFASFDKAGFASVDKPPVGLWIQAIFARVLGFHGWTIMLPQVIAATGSVIVLYVIVSRVFGNISGLIAALALAVAPITVAASRNNTSDTLLMFVLLLTCWAVVISLERNSIRMFALGMALVGVGFNVKMLEAYLILPALLLAWVLAPAPDSSGAKAITGAPDNLTTASIVAARRSWWNRIGGLIVGGFVLTLVSFSWATYVQLTPATDRPYISSSTGNNIFNLIFGYNGVARLLPHGWTIFGLADGPIPSGHHPALTSFSGENGAVGLFRLLNPNLGSQIGWLLPLALIGLFVAWGASRWWKLDATRLSLVIWGGWFLTASAFFSVAGFYHRYYLTVLSPAVAALVGIGIVALWNAGRNGGWRVVLLPASLILTAGVQVKILQTYPIWRDRLAPPIILLVACAIIGLVVVRLPQARNPAYLPLVRGVATMALVALLIAPGAWSIITTLDAATGSDIPAAGPSVASSQSPSVSELLKISQSGAVSRKTSPQRATFSGATTAKARAGSPSTTRIPAGSVVGTASSSSVSSDEGLAAYLLANQENAKYLVAVRKAKEGWGIILQTGGAVMDLGGYTGMDEIVTLDGFKTMIAQGDVRFALIGENEPKWTGRTASIGSWVAATCRIVPTSTYEHTSSDQSPTEDPGHMLYECGNSSNPKSADPASVQPFVNSSLPR
ncbi:MAG: glycosyltransferase family 39 protein [Thermomicrobiales bacterium]